MEEERLALMFSNRFEVLKNRVIQREEESESEVRNDRKKILREQRTKREVEIQQIKVKRRKWKKKGKIVERDNGEDRIEIERRRNYRGSIIK